MLAATLALTNCTKEIGQTEPETPDAAGIPFQFVASAPDVKTANDGMATIWENGDAVNLFHAAAGTTEYKSDGEFRTTGAETSSAVFSGSLSEDLTAGASYDWYAIYPYNSYISTPADPSPGYLTVGSKNNIPQTQTGNSNMKHIAGKNDPIAGVAKNVSGTEVPNITMTHLSSLLCINVKNSTAEPLTVSSVSFTAPEDIVGTYYIDVTGNEPSFTASGSSYVYNTASLEVADGEEIASGSSATFYLAIMPFTANAGASLTLNVNGTEKTIELTSTVTFTAGKIKTLNFNYDKVTPPTECTVAEFNAAEVDGTWYQLTGKITSIVNANYGNFHIEDETGSVYVYGLGEAGDFSALGLKVGDIVTIAGNRGLYVSTIEVINAYYISHLSSCDAPIISCEDNTVTITCGTEGATIYYTTDGTDPTSESTSYSQPFDITESCTIKAIAIAEGMPDSVVSEYTCIYVDSDAAMIERTATLDFATDEEVSFANWDSAYNEHIAEYEDATITFAKANKQPSGNQIDDCPVTKGNNLTIVMKPGKVIKEVALTLKQWGSKKQTVTLNYSTDYGGTYTATEYTSSDFYLSATSLEAGTNALQFTFSSTSNQVGIVSCYIKYEEPEE